MSLTGWGRRSASHRRVVGLMLCLSDRRCGLCRARSRSAAQQIAHWARIGREVEAGSASHREIAAVLAGASSYDGLTSRDQALVRAEWAERMTALREGLDLANELGGAGLGYSELDDSGN